MQNALNNGHAALKYMLICLIGMRDTCAVMNIGMNPYYQNTHKMHNAGDWLSLESCDKL